MNIKVTRSSLTSTELFAAAEADALALMRNHVRAIDDSDDDLLKVYLDAAIDYMQSLTDRLLGTHSVEVLVDYDELEHPVELAGVNNIDGTTITVKYRLASGALSTDVTDDTAGDYLADLKYIVIEDIYPAYIYFENFRDLVSDTATEYKKGYVKVSFNAGVALSSAPLQYKQAALLLVGHYYNMREAEAIGGITMELKEGVQRLMASARQY
jgi:hypothetical protein